MLCMKVLCDCWDFSMVFLAKSGPASVSYREQGKELFRVIDFYLCFVTSSKKAAKKKGKFSSWKISQCFLFVLLLNEQWGLRNWQMWLLGDGLGSSLITNISEHKHNKRTMLPLNNKATLYNSVLTVTRWWKSMWKTMFLNSIIDEFIELLIDLIDPLMIHW